MNSKLREKIWNLREPKRRHASYFECPNFDYQNTILTKIKEIGIVEDFLNPDNHHGVHDFVDFDMSDSDPPDAILDNKLGEKVALEITELVNEKAIDAQISKNLPTYKEECAKWRDKNYFEASVNECISKKDEKCSKKNLFVKFKNVHLLFHTDELWIEECYKRHVETGITINRQRFSQIWLMFSYSPHTQSCPIFELR
jgi:hypothetical protein